MVCLLREIIGSERGLAKLGKVAIKIFVLCLMEQNLALKIAVFVCSQKLLFNCYKLNHTGGVAQW